MQKYLLFSCVCMLASCWRTNNLIAPDISAQINATQAELERQEQVYLIMQRDMEHLHTQIKALFSEPTRHYIPPFPIHGFRLVAMSCVQESIIDDDLGNDVDLPPTPNEKAATYFGVSCTSSAGLAELKQRLESIQENNPKDAERVTSTILTQMHRIEDIRILNHRIAARQEQLIRITRQSERLLAEQRSSWRRIATSVDEKRFDYSPQELKKARDTLNAQRERHKRLEKAIKNLEQSANQWPKDLQNALNQLTYQLSWLGASSSDD